MTVSAAVKLIPSPPARVHNRNTNLSESERKQRYNQISTYNNRESRKLLSFKTDKNQELITKLERPYKELLNAKIIFEIHHS